MSELPCSCPHCGADLLLELNHAGEEIACPSCSGAFVVPEAPHLAPVLPDAPAHSGPKLNLPGAVAHHGPAPAVPPPPAPGQPPIPGPPPQSPYQAPVSNIAGPQSGAYGAPTVVPPSAIHLFVQTKPWVTLFAVLGSIWPVALVILGIFVGFVATGAGEVAGGLTTGLSMITSGLIYFLPAWRLWQYSGAINQLRIAPSPMTLDSAINAQRVFWKTVGIITLIGIALSFLTFALAIGLAASSPADTNDLLSD